MERLRALLAHPVVALTKWRAGAFRVNKRRIRGLHAALDRTHLNRLLYVREYSSRLVSASDAAEAVAAPSTLTSARPTLALGQVSGVRRPVA